MTKRRWDRIGSKSRGDWVLRAAYRHPAVSVRVEYAGKGGRRNRPRYSVRIIGPIQAVVLAYSTGVARWSLSTAKRKAEEVANCTSWLVDVGILPKEALDMRMCTDCGWDGTEDELMYGVCTECGSANFEGVDPEE